LFFLFGYILKDHLAEFKYQILTIIPYKLNINKIFNTALISIHILYTKIQCILQISWEYCFWSWT